MPRPGDFICRDIIDAPVFAIRQKDKSIKAFSNVCLHRSACLLSGDGHVSRISCPYHSWTYELDGRLIGAPFMQETAGFETKNYSLNELACEVWEGFIYVALGSKPTSIAGQLTDLTSLIGDFRIADYVPVFAEEETWDTNWKCLVENFMDVYHLHRVHRKFVQQSTDRPKSRRQSVPGWRCISPITTFRMRKGQDRCRRTRKIRGCKVRTGCGPG